MLFEHYRDADVRDLLREVVVLTKVNWNTASLEGLLPITLRFSHVVGEIMTEIPREGSSLPQFKF